MTNVNFDQARFEDWPVPVAGQGYDAVLGMSVLHLVGDLQATLLRVRKSLKPGGLFFSSTACLGDSGGIARFMLPPLGAIGILPKLTHLTAKSLIRTIESNGFDVEHSWRPSETAGIFVIARRTD